MSTRRTILRSGIVGGILVSPALAIAAVLFREASLGAAAGLGLTGTVLAFQQTRRKDPRAGITLAAWATLLGLLIPLSSPTLVGGLVVALITVAVIGVLVLRQPHARRFITYVAILLASQYAWAVAQGRPIESVEIGVGVLELAALLVGARVTLLVKDELARTALEYRDLFENVPVGLYRSTPSGRVTDGNLYLTKMLGLSDGNPSNGLDLAGLEQDPAPGVPPLMTCTDPDHAVERRLELPDGQSIWVREKGRGIEGEGGHLVGHEGVLENITNRKLAEEAARQADERFRRAFRDAPIGMAIVSRDGRFESVNQSFCEMLGFDEDELLAMGWRDITLSEDEEESVAVVQRLMADGGGATEMERNYIRADGQLMVGKVSLSLIMDEIANTGYIVAQLVDITAEKHLQEHMEKLVAAKDEFVASISHELRTPLTGLVGLAVELRDNGAVFEATEREEIIADVAEQGTVLAQIVEDLLVVARADIEQLAVQPGPTDLHQHIQTALSECRHLTEGQRLVLSPSEGEAWVDPLRFRQIMRNLLTNAIRYGGERIRVEVEKGNGRALVQVIDNGAGIPTSDHEAIFDPYQRAHNARGIVGSVGLGLAVSRKLARAMGGEITYRREQGESIFELDLPTQPERISQ